MTNGRVMIKNGKVGEGVRFERIRRITGYLWVHLSASIMPKLPRKGTASSTDSSILPALSKWFAYKKAPPKRG